MPKSKVQSVEPQVTEVVNGWLKSYGLKYYLQQESMNAEIDAALEKAESKSGGNGGNRPDAKLIIQDSKLDYYPVMVEYKGYENALEKLDEYGHVDNIKANGTPNYNNIKKYAVNGAIHYADAILQYTSYTDVISIGVTGYKNEHDQLQLKIGVYFVSKDNYGEGRKVADYEDLSFLMEAHFDDFVEKVHSLELSLEDLKRIHDKRENQIDDALAKINQNLFQNKEASLSAQSRINLVAASIMANLGVPGKVSPLEPKDLKSSIEDENTDGDIMLRKIENFLNKRKLPDGKRKQIMNSLSITILDDSVNKPRNGGTLLKEVFTEIIDELGYFYKVGLDTDFTGKLFNTMFSWLSFAGDDQNDVVLTPRYVAHLMAQLCRVNMNSYVWDFATGSAGLLVAAMHQMIQDAKENTSSPEELETKIESIKKEQILGIEVVAEIYMLAVLNMILMGDGSSNIIKGDSLKEYNGSYGYEKENETFPADVFLLNPPYSALGNGMVFVKRALNMMMKGYAAVIIQDSAGSGQAVTYNREILKKNTLLASIKMPKDLFRGKSSVQTSIYVFKVGEKHEAKTRVRFIDFSNDGYKRSARKKAKAKKKLKDNDRAEERYREVVNLVKYGAGELNIFTSREFVEDTIALKGKYYGADWNFDQHRIKNNQLSFDSYRRVVGDYLDWQIISMNDNRKLSVNDFCDKLTKMEQTFIDTGGTWVKYKVEKLFKIDNTKGTFKKEHTDDMIPVVTNSSKNNGITKYQKREATEEGGIITYSDTTTTDTIFYQPSPFAGFSHVKKMTPINREKWNESCCLFFISALKHQISGDFDYDHKLNIMGEIEVPLPTRNGEIDFDYMDAYILEMKRTHVKMLKAYFDATIKLYSDIISSKDDAHESISIDNIQIEVDIDEESKFVDFLPVYSLRAACGYFEDNSVIPENEAEGWVNIESANIRANKNMFVVYASGNSMQPDIEDGDLCVFELYSPVNGGSREGKIVLTQCLDKDSDYECHYTIKKYHSTWHYDEDGRKIHDTIELIPLNKDEYESREMKVDTELRTIGIFKGVIKQ